MVAELNGIEATAQIMKRHPAVNVAKNTVKDHVRVILEKLGVRDRIQAVTKALERGILHVG